MLPEAFIRLRSLANRAARGHSLTIDRTPRPLPRKIWLFWAQGLDAAPKTVQLCVDSWKRHHPGWDLTIVTDATLADHLDRRRYPATISLNHLANMLRVHLLRDHGGVWVDATSFCTRPLDHWLPPLMEAGFFAYSRPTPGRIMANWFISSEPSGVLITRLVEAVERYWRGRTEASDYFWFHYTFEWLTLTDRTFRRHWDAVPKLSPDGAHAIFAARRAGTLEDGPGADVALDAIPVHKLSWKEPVSPEVLAKWGIV